MAQREAGRILIVDDEVPLLAVMERYIRRLGYEVTACRNGQQAWMAFSAQPSAYALVLADITMPEMSGPELLLRMLQVNPQMCMVISSGYPFDPSSLPAKPGQVGFLQKPFTPKMLVEAIQQLLTDRQDASPA